jgi:hypothetical protein
MRCVGDRQYWARKRWEYLDAARECRRVLTSQGGLHGYEAGDHRVAQAVGKWVEKARDAHAFALGRKPVTRAFVLSAGAASVADVYAQEGA